MTHYDLAIIGTGSGNSVPTPEMDDWKIAIIEEDMFGGTCLNRGCIPSKMFVYAADMAEHALTAERLGVHTSFNGVDWPAIVDRVFGRIDPIASGGEEWRDSLDNTDVYKGRGRLIGDMGIEVGDRHITADRIVVAVGARPHLPDVPGLNDVPFHTSDTIMRVRELPERLVVIGGGYIAGELGHVIGSFGTEVTFILRSDRMFRAEDEQISEAATRLYSERFEVKGGSKILDVRHDGSEFVLRLERNGGVEEVAGDALLVASGRIPNSDTVGAAAAGLALHDDGRIITDETMATNVPGIWALGDITNPFQLKHLANAEARVVSHNLMSPESPIRRREGLVPHAIFGSPQIAGVGPTEQALREDGREYVGAVNFYAGTAYGWAMEDSTSFVKLLGDPATGLLLGAHIMGPQAASLIQQLIQGMRFGQTVEEMARDQFYIHPALTEAVEGALLQLADRLRAA